MAMFDLEPFSTLVASDSRTATVGGLSFRSRSLIWIRGRESVKLLKTGRIRIDYLDHSHLSMSKVFEIYFDRYAKSGEWRIV